MDEDHYRDTYDAINRTRCVFEKAINARYCSCSQMRRFYLADREGVRCLSTEAQAQCSVLIEALRENARFALKVTQALGPLPHNKEIKVQCGGLLGIQTLVQGEVAPDGATAVHDVYASIQAAVARHGSVQALPYGEIVPFILRHQARRRRAP